MKGFYKSMGISALVGLGLVIVGGIWFSAERTEYKDKKMPSASYDIVLSAKDCKHADTLKIKAAFSELEIVPTKEKDFRFVADEIPEMLKPELICEGTTVTLKMKTEHDSISDFAYYDFDSANAINAKSTLYVPDKFICDAELNVAFGEFTVKDLSFNSLDVESAFGEATLENVSVKNECSVQNAFGELNLNKTEICGEGSFNNSFGEICADLKGDYSVKGNNAFGEVNGSAGINSSEFLHSKDGCHISVNNAFGEVSVSDSE